MGSYDGMETCELVGSFLLSQLQDLDVNIGLYRDDGLVISKVSPRRTENIKKHMSCLQSKWPTHYNWSQQTNHQLPRDVTFNLNNTYQPFTKPNTTLQYVHRESNHPPITTKNMPAGINKRLSSLSSDKASFDQAAPPDQKALDESGYHYTLHSNRQRLLDRKTDNVTTSAGTILHSAKMSTLISVTDSSP